MAGEKRSGRRSSVPASQRPSVPAPPEQMDAARAASSESARQAVVRRQEAMQRAGEVAEAGAGLSGEQSEEAKIQSLIAELEAFKQQFKEHEAAAQAGAEEDAAVVAEEDADDELDGGVSRPQPEEQGAIMKLLDALIAGLQAMLAALQSAATTAGTFFTPTSKSPAGKLVAAVDALAPEGSGIDEFRLKISLQIEPPRTLAAVLVEVDDLVQSKGAHLSDGCYTHMIEQARQVHTNPPDVAQYTAL
jgi:hypothetical protein